jgi:NAD(P)H-dependent FMN reductase
MAKNIKLIIGSTRQGRAAEEVANWFIAQGKDAGYNLDVIDLRDVNLPMFDSAVSPAYAPVDTPEAKAWAKIIDDADGLVFLTAEYNRSIPASLKSAIDYLFKEWENKPSAIVSYGYIDGGQSATSHLKDILEWVKASLVEPNVAVQFTQETFDRSTGKFFDADASLGEYKEDFLKALEEIEKA